MTLRSWLSDLPGIQYLWANGSQQPSSSGLEIVGTGVSSAYDPGTNRNVVTLNAAAYLDVQRFGAVGNGTTDDTAAIQAALTAAATTCGTVFLPPTANGYRVFGSLTVPPCVRLLGAFGGHRRGLPKAGAGLTPRGSTLLVDGSYTGNLILLGGGSCVEGIEIFYPDQVTTGTPDTYGWSVYADGAAAMASVLSVSMPNTFQGIFCEAEGIRVDNVAGWGISRGILLGRVADVARISNVHFNSNAWPAGSALITWYDANGRPFHVDGAEEFQFQNCFSYGGLVGLTFEDIDADGAASYGAWIGGGWDVPATGIDIVATSTLRPLDARGLRLVGAHIIPRETGIKFSDNLGGGISYFERPSVQMNNVSLWRGGNYNRAVWFTDDSQGMLTWETGYAADIGSQGILIGSPDVRVRLDNVFMQPGATRISNPGAATDVEDFGA